MAQQYNQQYHQQYHQQQQQQGHGNPRFSWQASAEDPNATRQRDRAPLRIDTQQQTTQSTDPTARFSWMDESTGQPAQRQPAQRAPTEPTIPHSPVETIPQQYQQPGIWHNYTPAPTTAAAMVAGYNSAAANLAQQRMSYSTQPAREDEIKSAIPPDVYPARTDQQQPSATYPPNHARRPAPLHISTSDDLPTKKPSGPQSPTPYTPYEPDAVHAHSGKHTPMFAPDSSFGPNGLQPDLHKPGQIAHPNMKSAASPEWTHSLCSCGPDVGGCLTGIFCPCIMYGKTAYRLSRKSDRKDPTVMLGWKSVNSSCTFMSAACGLWCLFPLVQRVRIRHQYKIEGSLFSDIAHGCCCCCCVAVQNEREVRDREETLRRWAGPAGSGQYVPEGQMVYAPPPR